jgi:translation initiation factor 5A
MVLKLISATEAKPGTNIILDGVPYTVKSMDISKTGKHGAHKCKVEAISMLGDKKKVFVIPGTDRFEVPLVEKRKAQVLSISDSKISVMDLESFETIELECPDEIKPEIEVNSTIEYWDIEGEKIVKRKI